MESTAVDLRFEMTNLLFDICDGNTKEISENFHISKKWNRKVIFLTTAMEPLTALGDSPIF